MAKIKVQQKLGLEDFKSLAAQIKGDGVQVISGKNPSIEYITGEDYLGKVSNAFNLGKKVEVLVEMKSPDTPLTGYHFRKVLNDRWFLTKLDD